MFEPDSGAEVNVMDEYQFNTQKESPETKILKPSKVKIKTQNELQVKGEITVPIKNKRCEEQARFVIIKGKINSNPLIGRTTLEDLGMLKIDPDEIFADEDRTQVNTVKVQDEYKELLNKYANVFKGIGKIFGKKNNKDIYAHFKMKSDAIPVTQKARPVPYYLQDPLKEWLQECKEKGIFEDILQDELKEKLRKWNE